MPTSLSPETVGNSPLKILCCLTKINLIDMFKYQLDNFIAQIIGLSILALVRGDLSAWHLY